MNDVTKENDLGRMYKHLLNQKTTMHAIPLDDGGKKSTTIINDKDNVIEVDKSETDLHAGTLNDKDNDSEQQSQSLSDETSIRNDNTGVNNSDEVVVDEISVEDNVCSEEMKETKEERRRRLFAKRTSNDAAMSAKERYLARKKSKLSQPTIIVNDDD